MSKSSGVMMSACHEVVSGAFWSDTFPAWLAAVSTAGALVAAVIAAVIAKQLLEREGARDERVIRNDEQAQAFRVAAWVTAAQGEGSTVPQLHVRNSSDVPIYRATAFLIAAEQQVGLVNFGLVPPTQDPIDHDIADYETWAWKDMPPYDGSHPTPWPLSVRFEFTDASGQRWSRSDSGVLEPMPPEKIPSLPDFKRREVEEWMNRPR